MSAPLTLPRLAWGDSSAPRRALLVLGLGSSGALMWRIGVGLADAGWHAEAVDLRGHGSAPHMTRDPIPVACEMVTALQTLVTRRVDINDPVVLTVGKFAAGTKENIIPDEAVFEATIRSFSAVRSGSAMRGH